jgi:hypothetical protein
MFSFIDPKFKKTMHASRIPDHGSGSDTLKIRNSSIICLNK